MTFDVVVLTRANLELTSIVNWIAERSTDGAIEWLDVFESAKHSLEKNPLAFGFALENEFVDLEIRQILFGTRRGSRYRAVYHVDGNKVRILHVRGPGQPPLSAKDF